MSCCSWLALYYINGCPRGPIDDLRLGTQRHGEVLGGLLSLLEIKAICADLWRCPNGPMPIPHQPVAAGFSRGTTGCLDTAIAAVQRDLDAAVPCTRVERVGDMKNMRVMGFSG